MKRKKCIEFLLTIATVTVLCTACGAEKNENDNKQDNNQVTEQAEEKGRYSSSDTTVNLKRLYSDVVDIWNPLCDLNWWSMSGTDSTGGILDADLRYEDFKRACEILPEADEFVDSLSDDEYSYIKTVWGKLRDELDILIPAYEEDPPTVKMGHPDGIGIGLIDQYIDALGKEINGHY